jgi:hypothetical protein
LKTVRQLAGVAVSGRPAKSTTAIVDKLNRESIRLTHLLEVLEVGSASDASKSDIVEKGKVTIKNTLLELLATSGADNDFPH